MVCALRSATPSQAFFSAALKIDRPPPARRKWGKPARAGRGLYSAHAAENGAPETYFNEVLIAVNLVLSLEPSPFTAVRIAREMPAAIRPYSMAVAAVSSFKNLEIIFTASVPSRYSVQANRSG
jgi:hypothetical protein